MSGNAALTAYDQYQATRYFPRLDGLRAISVLMVLAFHTSDGLWEPLHGYLGVTVFFVISGFLITTLLLREEDRDGKVSIKNFYVRRVFRIFPLYYLALAAYTFLVLGLGLGADPSTYLDRLPLLATYNGEFAGSGTFSHSWSLGIEEKFYLLWPFLGFGALALRKHRRNTIVALLLLSIAFAPFEGLNYLSIYTPILAGCLLAILMHKEETFRVIYALSKPMPGAIISVAALLLLVTNDEQTYVHIPFGLVVTALLPMVLLGPDKASRFLRWRPIVYVGTRAYGIYLFHPIVAAVVEKALPEGSESLPVQIMRLALIFVGSLGVADALYRVLERPLIRVGRNITGKRTPATVV